MRTISANLDQTGANEEGLHALIVWPATFAGYRAAAADELITGALDVRARLPLPSMHYFTLRQLVVRVYAGEAFVGSQDDGFRFSRDKTNWVWRESDVTQVIVVESPLERLLELKEDVRALCGIGRHAIHTTDTDEELYCVWDAARLLHRTGFQQAEVWLR
ncbi:hypothetical protein [Gordonia sp. NPDC058843]|uniref:hypothetical protein n=1 Tax=Gordonia sp. NPDC058843 TaxID=3346648 RepID=UPI0036BD1D16